MHDVLHPGEVGVAHGWHAVFPALVLAQAFAAPVGDVERRIGEDEVGLEVRKAVVVEGVALLDLTLDAADGQVHLGQPPGGVVRLLAVNRDVGTSAAAVAVAGRVGTDELDRLHEHAAGAAAGVVDAAAVGLEHLDQQFDDTTRGEELTTLLALGAGELRQEVLVHAAEHVFGAGGLVANLDVADQVDQLPKARLVERGAGVILGQHALERRIVALDAGHRVVHELPDRGLFGLRFQVSPARLGRHPEDVHRAVFVRVFGIGALRPLGFELCVLLVEGVRDILQRR